MRDLSKEEWPGLWVAGWGFSALFTLGVPVLLPPPSRGWPYPAVTDGVMYYSVGLNELLGVLGSVYGLFLYLAIMVRCRFDCQILSTRASLYRWLLLLYPIWIIPTLFTVLYFFIWLVARYFPLYRKMYDAMPPQWQRFLE